MQMKVIKCDRCGKYVTVRAISMVIDGAIRIDRNDDFEGITVHRDYDLCESCFKDFEKFMHGKGFNIYGS